MQTRLVLLQRVTTTAVCCIHQYKVMDLWLSEERVSCGSLPQAEIFELDLDTPQAKHVCKWGKDTQSLKGNIFLLMGRHAGHGAHVV